MLCLSGNQLCQPQVNKAWISNLRSTKFVQGVCNSCISKSSTCILSKHLTFTNNSPWPTDQWSIEPSIFAHSAEESRAYSYNYGLTSGTADGLSSTTIPMHREVVQAERSGGMWQLRSEQERACKLATCVFSYLSDSGRQAGRQATGITYLLHGHGHRPQRFPRSVKFFSASFMSLLIWSIPSSMRSSCSDLNISQLRPQKK